MAAGDAQITLVDNDTGAVLDGTVLTFNPRNAPPKARFDAPWLAVFYDGLDVLMDAHLTVSDYRIFAAICRRANQNLTEWELRAPDIAARLHMDERRVYRGVKTLVDAGILRRPRLGHIAFNPALVWRGSSANRATAIRDEDTAAAAHVEQLIEELTHHSVPQGDTE